MVFGENPLQKIIDSYRKLLDATVEELRQVRSSSTSIDEHNKWLKESYVTALKDVIKIIDSYLMKYEELANQATSDGYHVGKYDGLILIQKDIERLIQEYK